MLSAVIFTQHAKCYSANHTCNRRPFVVVFLFFCFFLFSDLSDLTFHVPCLPQQTIHMKYPDLFSLKNNKINFRMSSAANLLKTVNNMTN